MSTTKTSTETQKQKTANPAESDALKKEISQLRDQILVASENGLAGKTANTEKQTEIEEILELLRHAETEANTDTIQAGHTLDTANCRFDKLMDKAGLKWRMNYVYGVPIFLYLAGLFIFFLLLWHALTYYNLTDMTILWIPGWSLVWGGVGSTLRGIYYLWYQINRRNYRKLWLVWFLATPFMGCILGSITYLVFAAGYIATAQPLPITRIELPMLLCALAGFSWQWAVDTLQNLTKIFGAKT